MSDIINFSQLIDDNKEYNESTFENSIQKLNNINIDTTFDDLIFEGVQLSAQSDLALESSIIQDALIRFWEKVKYIIHRIIDVLINFFRNIAHWFRYTVCKYYDKLVKNKSILDDFFRRTDLNISIKSKPWKDKYPFDKFMPDLRNITASLNEISKITKIIFEIIEKKGIDAFLADENITSHGELLNKFFSYVNAAKNMLGVPHDDLRNIINKNKDFYSSSTGSSNVFEINFRNIENIYISKYIDTEMDNKDTPIKDLFISSDSMLKVLSLDTYNSIKNAINKEIGDLKNLYNYASVITNRVTVKNNDRSIGNLKANNIASILTEIRNPLKVYIGLCRAMWNIYYSTYRDAIKSANAIINKK